MGVRDIKKSSSVVSLINHIRKLPSGISKPLLVLVKERDKEKQVSYLKSLPEDTLIYLIKACTYVLLSSGVVMKESFSEMLLTDEIQLFLAKVREEVGDAKEVTKEKVSSVVDQLLATTFEIGMLVGLITVVVPLLLNPVTMPMGLSILAFTDMIVFLIEITTKSGDR